MNLRSKKKLIRKNENANKNTKKSQPIQKHIPKVTIQNPSHQIEEDQNEFNELYKSLSVPGAFSSKIKKFLRQNITHSLHKSLRKNFKRRKIITRYPGQILEMDLVDMRKFSNQNSNYNYILVAIDLFSKKIWLRALKTKKGMETARAISSIFSIIEYPIQTIIFDEGKEFLNKNVRLLFKQFNIHAYNILTKTKAGGVERVNKTIKQILWKFFFTSNTKRWIDILQNVQDNYNSTYHSSIKTSPNSVSMKNREKIFKILYPKLNDYIKCNLKKGDRVRIALNKPRFEKGFTINWSKDIYTITHVFHKAKVCWYRIKDSKNNIYPKSKYFYQLNQV